MCRAHVQYPVFALGSYKVASGILVSVFGGPEFAPSVHACSYLPSHIVHLYFVAGGELYSGASSVALQERVPGPSRSQFWKWTFFSYFPFSIVIVYNCNYS